MKTLFLQDLKYFAIGYAIGLILIALTGCDAHFATSIGGRAFYKGTDPRGIEATHNTRAYHVAGSMYDPRRPGQGGMQVAERTQK